MKKWEVQKQLTINNSQLTIEKIVNLLLENRGIKTAKEREEFLNPQLKAVTPRTVGIDVVQLKQALVRIKKAIENKEQIIVFGDYDVDGITGAAILWETLHLLGADVMPYIPHRVDEGYGLSVKALESKELLALQPKLIITVDNGIVANDAVIFANKKNIDVIITDHHTVGALQPEAFAIVHTTKLCGAGVAYLLAQELREERGERRNEGDAHLELAALGTVADMVPLQGANRAIVKYGLEKLSKTGRYGLLALFKQARLEKEAYGVYDIGFVIAPRLNAAGRIESAMDSLRLLCTKDAKRAEVLSEKLELINRERQVLMKAATEHAKAGVRSLGLEARKLLFVADGSYPQGVIGLVAGKLVEEFYRPSIVVAIGEKYSKASVRSVSGFNIVEFLRSASEYFVNLGGHPMAAGFTVETEKLSALKTFLEERAEKAITDTMLAKALRIDCELPLSLITPDLYNMLQSLAPFGMGNPEPVFVTKKVVIESLKALGAEGKHLKLILSYRHSGEGSDSRIRNERDSGQARMTESFEAIGFGMGELAMQIKKGDEIDVVYAIDENTWNGNTKLQLKLKDIHFVSKS